LREIRKISPYGDVAICNAHNAALAAANEHLMRSQHNHFECQQELAAERKDRDDLAFRLNAEQEKHRQMAEQLAAARRELAAAQEAYGRLADLAIEVRHGK
jgi:hypothetical protein